MGTFFDCLSFLLQSTQDKVHNNCTDSLVRQMNLTKAQQGRVE